MTDVAMYPCNRTSGGAACGPLATTWVFPNLVGTSNSAQATGHRFMAASYAA
jgi:hypothetical protein